MSSDVKVDPSQTHFQVRGLDENATVVRRQIEEAYEKRATQVHGRLRKIDPQSEEAKAQGARLGQLNAARAVLVKRSLREAYKEQLRTYREAQRDLADEQRKSKGKEEGSSAVLVLHLRQQVERLREEQEELHKAQYARHAYDHDESKRPAKEQVTAEQGEEAMRRRTAPAGEAARGLAELAGRRPVRRV